MSDHNTYARFFDLSWDRDIPPQPYGPWDDDDDSPQQVCMIYDGNGWKIERKAHSDLLDGDVRFEQLPPWNCYKLTNYEGEIVYLWVDECRHTYNVYRRDQGVVDFVGEVSADLDYDDLIQTVFSMGSIIHDDIDIDANELFDLLELSSGA